MSGALLSASQLKGIQKLGERGMNITASIYARLGQAKDPGDPYGDDIVSHAATAVVTKAWLVTKPTETLDQGEGQARTISTHQLRVPVGTVARPGDRIVVGGEQFIATDVTNEQSWPEWTLIFLRGYEGE